MCVKLLGDIMDLLYVVNTGSTFNDITKIMLTIMRTVIQTSIPMDRDGSLVVFKIDLKINEKLFLYILCIVISFFL